MGEFIYHDVGLQLGVVFIRIGKEREYTAALSMSYSERRCSIRKETGGVAVIVLRETLNARIGTEERQRVVHGAVVGGLDEAGQDADQCVVLECSRIEGDADSDRTRASL